MSFLERVENVKDTECIVDVLLNEVSTNECKECGKCVFGYEGISQLEMILGDIVEKKGRGDDLMLIQDLCELMKSQSLCETGEDVADAVLKSVQNYEKDITDHIQKRECKAGVCKKFMTFHVLVSRCDGCGKCIGICDDEAILGKKNFVHVIDQKECCQCGKCIEICPKGAIVMAGAKKPKTPKKPIPVRKKK